MIQLGCCIVFVVFLLLWIKSALFNSVQITEFIDVDPEFVWRAITEEELLKTWLGGYKGSILAKGYEGTG